MSKKDDKDLVPEPEAPVSEPEPTSPVAEPPATEPEGPAPVEIRAPF